MGHRARWTRRAEVMSQPTIGSIIALVLIVACLMACAYGLWSFATRPVVVAASSAPVLVWLDDVSASRSDKQVWNTWGALETVVERQGPRRPLDWWTFAVRPAHVYSGAPLDPNELAPTEDAILAHRPPTSDRGTFPDRALTALASAPELKGRRLDIGMAWDGKDANLPDVREALRALDGRVDHFLLVGLDRDFRTPAESAFGGILGDRLVAAGDQDQANAIDRFVASCRKEISDVKPSKRR